MSIVNTISNKLGWMNPKVASVIEKGLKTIPFFKKQVDKEFEGIVADLEKSLKPYEGVFKTYGDLPVQGRNKSEILEEMRALKKKEEAHWKEGYVSGAVYHGDEDHIRFLNEVYAINSQTNPLHSDLWPSGSKFEAEIISMTANMLGAKEATDAEVCGSVSSGGTESICLAMKTYRDWARDTKKITKPEMIIPVTAHAAFEKAAHYFGIKLIKIPVDKNYQADVAAAEKAITKNTIVLVGSAPAFPHGVIDPIEALSELARERGIGFHTDACLGGFVLPFAEKLGYPVPGFDFRLPGVTSMSADTHKYGYAAKGTSVVLYRHPELRHYQYFTTTDWPGGLYMSPTFAGSRAGALSAACWASLLSVGEEGYLKATKSILETATKIKAGIATIRELYVIGDPLFVIAIASDTLNIYEVMDFMTQKGWNLNGLHKPSCVHIAITLRQTQAGVAERFIADLREAVTHAKAGKKTAGGDAPIYGMAASLPFRGLISDVLKKYLDVYYKV